MGVVFAGAEVCEPGRGADAQAGDAQFGRGELAAEVMAAAERAAGFGDDVPAKQGRKRPHRPEPGDPVEERSQAVVAAAEAELGRSVLSSTAESTLRDLRPGDTDAPPAADPARELPDPAGALSPVAGPNEDRDDFGRPARASFDREVVDLAAAAAILVEELVVEQLQADVDLLPLNSVPRW